MIRNKCNLVLIKNIFFIQFFHFMYGNRTGDIVGKHHIKIRLD